MNSIIESGILFGIIAIIVATIIFIFEKIKGKKIDMSKHLTIYLVLMLLIWVGIKFLQTNTFYHTVKNGGKITPNININATTTNNIENNVSLSPNGFPPLPEGFMLQEEFLTKKCLENNIDSCSELADLYYQGIAIKQDSIKAIEFYNKACVGGDYESCFHVGYLYHFGNKGVEQNLFKALNFYSKACQNNIRSACENIELIDTKIRIAHYEEKCKIGDLKSCLELGYIFSKGKKETQNFFKAFELYKKVCEEGISAGCWNLGYLYEKGQGVKQDNLKAAEQYSKACEEGNPFGCLSLGTMFGYGNGVAQNYNKALQYYGRACDLKEQLGCDAYSKLKLKLNK